MEVTINYNGQAVAVEVTLEVYEFLDRADHKTENLFHEQRRHWDGREFDEYIITTEGVGAYEELIRRLYEAISSLPPMQARRVHARYMLGMKVKDIAAKEGITPAQAGKSIHAALRRLRRYFARQKWTVNL